MKKLYLLLIGIVVIGFILYLTRETDDEKQIHKRSEISDKIRKEQIDKKSKIEFKRIDSITNSKINKH